MSGLVFYYAMSIFFFSLVLAYIASTLYIVLYKKPRSKHVLKPGEIRLEFTGPYAQIWHMLLISTLLFISVVNLNYSVSLVLDIGNATLEKSTLYIVPIILLLIGTISYLKGRKLLNNNSKMKKQ